MKTLLFFLLCTNLSFGQSDKLLHASAGFVSSSITSSILMHYNVKRAPLIGFGVGAALGLGKELYDKYSGRGQAEIMDAVFTAGGAALGSVTIQFALRNNKKVDVRRPKF